MIKYLAKKILPDVVPSFYGMTDSELLAIITWAQKWPMEKVYNTAFEQVFPTHQLEDSRPDFTHWFRAENPRLPTIVRQELIRAFHIHSATGRMDVLRLGALAEFYSKRMMWIGLGVLFLILVFKMYK